MIEIPLVVGIIVGVLAASLLVYTFLIFPNFDGVMKNLTWYKYDSNSQHYLYWFGFWMIVLFGGVSAWRTSK